MPTVAELKEQCRAQGLPVSGIKADLKARLQTHCSGGGTPSRAAAPPQSQQPSRVPAVADLREQCRAQGLPVSGNKADLKARLETHRNGGDQSMATGSAYVTNSSHEGKPVFVEKILRLVAPEKKRFVHTVLTSCHLHPTKRDESSWIRVWRKATGMVPGVCAFAHCSNLATYGAHVSYSGSTTICASWYIVAACSTCNAQHNKAGELREDTSLVKVVQGPKTRKGKRQLMIGSIDARKAEELLKHHGNTRQEAIEVLQSYRNWNVKGVPADGLEVRVWPRDW